MAGSKIEWTDVVWNPVTGCSKVSEGCRNCYAERLAKRQAGRNGYPKDEPFRVTVHNDKFVQPLTWRKPRRVFVDSMSDLFHPDVQDDWIMAAFVAMGLTYEHTGKMIEVSPGHEVGIYRPKHTFMILTKRPQRMRDFITRLLSEEPDEEWDKKAHYLSAWLSANNGDVLPGNAIFTFVKWIADGMPGLWLGVSVENQAAADERIPVLLQTPAAVRFISAEPLLGPINLQSDALGDTLCRCAGCMDYAKENPERWQAQRVDWVIAGGESGPGARPMYPDWVRSLRDQCQAAGVPFFFKQWGEWNHVPTVEDSRNYYRKVLTYFNELDATFAKVGKKKAGRLLDGRTWDEVPEV